ncbi:MAG: hypothetical protein LBM63_04565 [Rikenellaceae bacterium]|jgi:hypothetical protein|nr:hypothetical protein [Rikenellaceae bacterium]
MKNSDNNARKHPFRKVWLTTLTIIIIGVVVFCAVRFYYPFGEGVKTGELNYVVHKGIVFKTYEGKLIQSGFRTTQDNGIASNEFVFSVVDEAVADSLMRMGGSVVELHYKEYFGRLPWRGYSKFIVDEILSVTPTRPQPNNYPPAAESGL